MGILLCFKFLQQMDICFQAMVSSIMVAVNWKGGRDLAAQSYPGLRVVDLTTHHSKSWAAGMKAAGWASQRKWPHGRHQLVEPPQSSAVHKWWGMFRETLGWKGMDFGGSSTHRILFPFPSPAQTLHGHNPGPQIGLPEGVGDDVMMSLPTVSGCRSLCAAGKKKEEITVRNEWWRCIQKKEVGGSQNFAGAKDRRKAAGRRVEKMLLEGQSKNCM